MKKLIYILIFLAQLTMAAWAEPFEVEHIQIQGLQGISQATVESYLPIRRGQILHSENTAGILRSLYKTGFFENVTIARDGNTLVIRVVERPTIGQLKIKGNSVIPTDKLTSVMKTMEIAEGRIYNPALIEKITKSLLYQYYMLGRYNARVDVTTSPMPRNRVSVNINISEGVVAKVKRITIIGNKVFDESTLVSQLEVSTTGLFTFMTQTDRYSEEKLEASLEKLRAYYMDRGYIRFEIKSAQAEVTPDRKSVYIAIIVEENDPYSLKDFTLEGKMVVPKDELMRKVELHPGEVFSRQKVIDTEKAITKFLGNRGYMFATVSVRPLINDHAKDVKLVFDIKPGKRVYVRHVTFSDNHRTNDEVLRREIVQMESAPVSTSKLDESKQHLTLLPYIREVEMTVKPVSDTNDQVDVNYKVKEDTSAQATFSVGYSQVYRAIFGAGFNQKNFFGTGNTLGVNLRRSKYDQVYQIDYTDPYYTPDGISRSISVAASRVDPRGAGVNNGYTTNEYDAGVLYGIPVGQESSVISRVYTGFGAQDTIVYLIPGGVSQQIQGFVRDHGTHIEELNLKLGYTRDSRDKAILPNSGIFQTLFVDGYVPLLRGSPTFFTMNYQGRWYQPLISEFILLTKADLGFGSGIHGGKDFPFFRNYYAGGIAPGMGTVRGYQGFTLGPRDSNGKPFGGNILTDASVALIVPNHLSENLRTSIFFDAGNVYSTVYNRGYGGASTDSGPIRYSVGVEADWLTPFGPIEISLAQPLNSRPHDQRESFQFSMGANF